MDLETKEKEDYGSTLLDGFDPNLEKAKEILFNHRDYSILDFKQKADIADPIMQAVQSTAGSGKTSSIKAPQRRKNSSDNENSENKKQKIEPEVKPDSEVPVFEPEVQTGKDESSYQASIADSALGSSITGSIQTGNRPEVTQNETGSDDWSDEEEFSQVFSEYMTQKKSQN